MQLRKHTGVGFAAASSPSRLLCEHASEVWHERAERELGAPTRPLFKRTRKRKHEMDPPCQANARAIPATFPEADSTC